MKHRFLFMPMIPVVIALAGCSVSTSSGGGDDASAVKSQALSGTVNGAPFTGKVAIAEKDFFDDKAMTVTIYDVDVTCDTKNNGIKDGDQDILLSVENWSLGLSYELDSAHSATFYSKTGGVNHFIWNGRVEIASSGQQLGFRGSADGAGSAEGQVPLIICK